MYSRVNTDSTRLDSTRLDSTSVLGKSHTGGDMLEHLPDVCVHLVFGTYIYMSSI